jgi:hypothetical protein
VFDRLLQSDELAKEAEGYAPEKTQFVSLNLLAVVLILLPEMKPMSAVFPEKMQESTVIPTAVLMDAKTPVVIELL